jgi:hypothetical protein
MRYKISFNIPAIALLAAAFLGACAAPPQLLAKSAEVPGGVDLSGSWRLQQEPGMALQGPRNMEQKIRIPPANSARRGSSEVRSRRSSTGPSVDLFLENGEALKITQTEQGLFISFDRAIVEEYTFGEKRVVTIGPIEAQRVSGWEDGRFVVQTMDDKGAVLTESWVLDADGDELLRDITLLEQKRSPVVTRQRFDRTVAD